MDATSMNNHCLFIIICCSVQSSVRLDSKVFMIVSLSIHPWDSEKNSLSRKMFQRRALVDTAANEQETSFENIAGRGIRMEVE